MKERIGILSIVCVLCWMGACSERLPFRCNMHRLKWSDLACIGGEELLAFDYPIIFHSPEGEEKELSNNLEALTGFDNLRRNHGNSVVMLSSSNAYSHGREESTLEIYLNTLISTSQSENERNESMLTLPADKVYYLFGGNYDGVWKEIVDAYRVRYCGNACNIAGAKTPGIGGENSGVSFHYHGPGFAEIIHGAKEWFFYPGSARELINRVGNADNMTTYTWKTCILPLLRGEIKESLNCSFPMYVSPEEKKILLSTLQECTIFPNELLFFPSSWMHATINLDKYNVFISTFMDPQLLHIEQSSNLIKVDL